MKSRLPSPLGPGLSIFLAGLGFLLYLPKAHAAGAADHILLIVWDGMRPDMVTPAYTPNLYQLGQSGTVFSHNHAVYPTSTEVNGTALATGMYPGHSGVIGNREYRPAILPTGPVGTESLTAIRKGDELTGGKYLAVPTLYETLQAHGIPTIVAGTKPVALIPDRSLDRSSGATAKSVNLFAGHTLPETLLPTLEKSLGKFPEEPVFPDKTQNTWTVDALLNVLWQDTVPKMTLLWLSDPDFSQHDTQPGHPEAIASLKVNDDLLGRVLDALKAKGIRDKTDILLVSDHGFSTVTQAVDFVDLLKKAGFTAARKFLIPPKTGDILVSGNGGSSFFYVTGHDAATTRKLALFLQQSTYCSTLFSREKLPGAFPLSAAHIDSADAPDLIAAFAWDATVNASGVAGGVIADLSSNRQGLGMHGSLSPYDLHNTLIANGPDFQAGFVDTTPTGNVDIAPTILSLLGIDPPQKLDGRVLQEAFASTDPKTPLPKVTSMDIVPTETHFDPANPENASVPRLKISTVESTEYIEEGVQTATQGKSN